MRIAVAGATGRIGRLTVAALERGGHQAVPISRGAGADAYTGAGLEDALRGADVVIDTMNNPSSDEAKIVDFAPLLVQPIAHADVAAVLAEVGVGAPLHTKLDIAGPQTQDLVDMARRTFAVRGENVTLVPTWRGVFGTDMAGEVLLPGEDARLTATSFEDWLAAGAQ